MQRRGLAVSGDAEEAQLALGAQQLEGRHDFLQHGGRGEIGALGGADDGVVKLKQIDRVHLQPREAGFERGGDRRADLARLGWRQSHLGADIDLGLQ